METKDQPELPITEKPAEEITPETPPEESITEHEAKFGPRRLRRSQPPAQPVSATPEPVVEKPVAEPTEEKTEPESTLKSRHRAKSQQAGPEDVPRIQELTKRLREAEAERDELRKRTTVATEPPAPVAAPLPAPLGKPKLEDFQTIDEFFDARDAYNRHLWATEQQMRQEDAAITTSWHDRVETAKKTYPDFEDIAFAPTTIKAGSLIDAHILESPTGADVLYLLQQDAQQGGDLLERIQAMKPRAQIEALTLLGQRSIQSRTPAARTGSAAAPVTNSVPRPPNPVRTGPIRSADEPPSDDASIAEHQAFWGSRLKRRR